MMVGCGYCEKTIRGRRYLYFWHYEARGGRREQVEEYVGPASSPESRRTVARRVAEYTDRAGNELASFVATVRSEMARSP